MTPRGLEDKTSTIVGSVAGGGPRTPYGEDKCDVIKKRRVLSAEGP